MTKVYALALGAALLLSSSGSYSGSPELGRGGFTWQAGPDVAAPQFNFVDSDPALMRDRQGRFWGVYSDGGSRWHTLTGSSMDTLVEHSVFDTHAFFPRPNGDDHYWIIGAWIDPATQTWYATVHVEFRYGAWGKSNGFHHYRRIALAVSADQGKTWKLKGDILTPPYPTSDDIRAYPGRVFYFGDGDQKLFVDARHGFFYVFYMSAWVDKTTGDRISQFIYAARAPIARRMAPGSWVKWQGGQWREPGLGGRESALTNADSFTVFWDTYLGEYLAIVNNGEGHFYACPDLATEHWADQGRIAAANGNGADGLLWYNWPVDGANLTGRFRVGQTFRLYSADNDFQNVGAKYKTITLRRLPNAPHRKR